MPPSIGDQTEYSGGAHDNETGVGAMLRASRMRLGEDLRSVAQMLCIRYPYLEAIEEGRFNDLPGQTYAIGFIRAYSDHLGLDSDELIRRYKLETAAGTRGQELSFPTPVPETGIPGGAIVFVGIVVAIFAYGAWYISTSENNILADLVSPVPERLVEQTEGAGQGAPPSEPARPAETAEPVAPAVTPKSEEDDTNDGPATSETTSAPEPVVAPNEQTAEPGPAVAEPSQETATEPEAADPGSTVMESETPAEAEQAIERAAAETGPSAESESSQGEAETTETPSPSVPEQEAAATSEPEPEPEPVSQPVEQASTGVEVEISRDEPTTSRPAQSDQSTTADEAEPAAGSSPSQAENADQPPLDQEQPRTGEQEASVAEPAGEAPSEAVAAPEPPPEAAVLPDGTGSTGEDEGDDSPPPEEITEEAAEEVAEEATDEAAEELAEEPTTQPLEEEVATVTEPAPPAEAPSAETAVASAGGPRIVLRAKTSSWIQVRDDAANQMLVTRLLRAGESYEVPDRPGLKLLTGNAGALEVVVDGQVAPSIGDVGVVRRGVVLDAERLLAGTAVDN